MNKKEELEKIRSQLGELQSEAKPFDPNEEIKITQVYSSIAAHSSSEFHRYRLQRMKEEQRLKEMDEEWDREVTKLEFRKKRLEQEEQERLEREVKREMRQKKKEKKKLQEHIDDESEIDTEKANQAILLAERKARLKNLLLKKSLVHDLATSTEQTDNENKETLVESEVSNVQEPFCDQISELEKNVIKSQYENHKKFEE